MARFQSLGLAVSGEEIMCASAAAADYLSSGEGSLQGGGTVLAVGTSGLVEELQLAGR